MSKLFATLSLALFAQYAQADVVHVDFTTSLSNYYNVLSQVNSVATLTLSLNGDGTIAAALSMADDLQWMGVAIDSPGAATQSNFANGTVTTWLSPFGKFATGLVCNPACTGPQTWTITGQAAFTSVSQLLSGTGSTYDAFLYGTFGQDVGTADAGPATIVYPTANAPGSGTNVPEPASIALLGLGLAGIGAARRRANRL